MQPPAIALLWRTTFQLRDVDGLSIRETADLLGVPTGTVKARLARARMRVREAISRASDERVMGLRSLRQLLRKDRRAGGFPSDWYRST